MKKEKKRAARKVKGVKQAKPAKRVRQATLGDVGKRALGDPDFWAELRRSPDATLLAYKMDLDPADRARLAEALQGKGLAEMDNLMEVVHRAITPGPPPVGGWNGMWKWGWP